jgi:alanyl-tRNA synthetase
VPERVQKLVGQVKSLEKELAEAKRRVAKDFVGELLGQATEVGGVRIVSAQVEPMDAAALRELADAVKGKLGSGLLLLASVQEGRCSLIAGVTQDLTGKYSANDIVKKAAACVGGGGGGRKDMAQAGGADLDGLPQALASLKEWPASK